MEYSIVLMYYFFTLAHYINTSYPMQSFRIKPEGHKEIKKKILMIMIPVFLVIMSIMFVTTFLNNSETRNSVHHPLDTTSLIITIFSFLVPFGVIFFMMFRFFARLKKVYESYELQISDNVIAREQSNTPTVSIYKKDVQEIVKRKKGAFTVRGVGAHDIIFIPKQIENYEELETALDQIKPISNKSQKSNLQIIQATLSLAGIGLMYCVILINNKIIVGIAAVLFLAITIWNFIQTQKSKNVQYRAKRFKWLSIIFAIVLIYIAFQKIMDYQIF
jgi:hypothetical protein